MNDGSEKVFEVGRLVKVDWTFVGPKLAGLTLVDVSQDN